MRFPQLILVCFLAYGSQAFLLDTLQTLGGNALDLGKQALQTTLNSLTTDGLSTLVQNGASALLTSLLGRRDLSSDHVKAFDILKEEAGNVEAVLKGYSQELQSIYDEIQSLNFLKGDTQKFMQNLSTLKAKYGSALDQIVSNFIAKTSALKPHKRALTDLLTGLQNTFTQTVATLKQTFSGVTDQLSGQSGGLLSQLAQGVANLNTGLAAKLQAAKETASQLLATGQESLATLHQTGTDVVHQTVNGIKGQAQQAVDALLHPGTK